MGLDMFLTAQKFFWSNSKDEKEMKDEETIKNLYPEMKGKKLDYVIFQVGYWRKANAIHKWFVDNVQDGEDNCETYYVDREKLTELLNVCKKIKAKVNLVKGKEERMMISNPEICEELLPSTSGFFFGCTDYDEWYLKDVENTIKIIEECMKLSNQWEFKYHASW